MNSSSIHSSGLCSRWSPVPRPRCQCFSRRSSRARGHTTDNAATSDLAAAWTLLKTFSKQEFQGRAQQQLGTASARQELRDALLLAYRNPWPAESWSPGPGAPDVLLGVVASDSRLAVRALRDWCQALDLPYTTPDCKVAGASSIATVKGAVYVKYNSVSRVCYMSLYQGRDRGVLVQLGPGQLLGHFPLGFWDEAMANPAPSLEQLPQLPEQQPQLQ